MARLPGPADTKTFHYDEQGRLRFVQHPIPDLQERFAYDEAGRIIGTRRSMQSKHVLFTPLPLIHSPTGIGSPHPSAAGTQLIVSIQRARLACPMGRRTTESD